MAKKENATKNFVLRIDAEMMDAMAHPINQGENSLIL